MAYLFTEAKILPKGYGVASVVSAASAGLLSIRPGFRARAIDPSLGGAEFIYLPTVASVTAGSLVTFRQSASGVFTTAPCPNTAVLAQPVAVAMAAGAANNYGWFMTAGTAPVKKSGIKVNPNVVLYISATTGRVTSSVASGKEVLAFRSSNSGTVASATSTVTVTFSYPHMQGRAV